MAPPKRGVLGLTTSAILCREGVSQPLWWTFVMPYDLLGNASHMLENVGIATKNVVLQPTCGDNTKVHHFHCDGGLRQIDYGRRHLVACRHPSRFAVSGSSGKRKLVDYRPTSVRTVTPRRAPYPNGSRRSCKPRPRRPSHAGRPTPSHSRPAPDGADGQ